MKTVLVGAIEGSVEALRSLAEVGRAPEAVVTLPLSKAGRHSDFADIRPCAEEFGVPVIETTNVNDATCIDAIRAHEPDAVLVLGWSQLLRAEFLQTAARAIGFHPSLLPENRGRGVVPWTILQRKRRTGATLFVIDEGMDSGAVVAQTVMSVAPDETARTLYDKQVEAMKRMVVEVASAAGVEDLPARPQDHAAATYCARRVPEDGRIDWTRPADDVWTLIRATTRPYPGAFAAKDGEPLVVWHASLRDERGRHWASPGQIVEVHGGAVVVMCGDGNAVAFDEVGMPDGSKAPASSVVRLHQRFDLWPVGHGVPPRGAVAW